MINAIRTLLLNRDSAQTSASDFGSDYVPPAYRAVRLSTPLQRVSRVLFGAAPDTAGKNYRLRQFLPLLHAPEIVSYTLAGDERFTYDVLDERLFLETHTPHVTQLMGSTPVSFVIPDGALETDTGKLQYNWLCLGSDPESYDPFAGMPPGMVQMPPSWSSGLSDPIELPDSGGIAVRLGGAEMPASSVFEVALIKRPSVSLAALPGRLEAVLTEEVAHALFGDTGTAPFSVFRAWWEESQQLHFRLSGVLLALALRTDDIRRQGG